MFGSVHQTPFHRSGTPTSRFPHVKLCFAVLGQTIKKIYILWSNLAIVSIGKPRGSASILVDRPELSSLINIPLPATLISGSVTWVCDFDKYIGITIDNSNNKIVWVRSLRRCIFYFLWGFVCDRISELHCNQPVEPAGARLVSMMIPDYCVSGSYLLLIYKC